MTLAEGRTRASTTMRYLILLLVTLVALAPGLATLPPIDRDESRFVQASKQMVESGDYVDISFQDQKRYKKPIGVYWLQSAAVGLGGYGEDAPIWIFRLVSVLGAAGAVLATAWTGARLFGPAAGLMSGLAMAGIFAIAFEGRVAKTDAALLAFTVLAQGALAQVYVGWREGRPTPPHLAWLFWIAQGCGILVKGPITPLASILTILALVLLGREWRWLSGLKPVRGLAIAAAIELPWLVLITWKSGAAFWQESVGKDLLGKVVEGQESHGLPPGFYILTYGLYMWPFGLLALAAGLHAWNAARQDPRLRFLIAWYLTFWLFFELIPTKLPNYVIPAYPALLLMIGWAATAPPGALVTPRALWQIWLLRLAAAGQVAVGVGLAVAAVALPLWLEGRVPAAGIGAAVFALLAGYLGLAFDPVVSLKRIAAAAAAALVAFGLMFGAVIPSIETMWLSPRIAAAVAADRPCEDTVLAATGFHEPSLVFLVGTRTLLTDVEGSARHLAADPACAMALVPADQADRLAALLEPTGITPRSVSRIEGINYSSGRRLSLLLFRADP